MDAMAKDAIETIDGHWYGRHAMDAMDNMDAAIDKAAAVKVRVCTSVCVLHVYESPAATLLTVVHSQARLLSTAHMQRAHTCT